MYCFIFSNAEHDEDSISTLKQRILQLETAIKFNNKFAAVKDNESAVSHS